MRIVFVCTGNLCRSPMAEALLRRAVTERGCDDVEISSMGTWAYNGRPATEEAIEALRAGRIDLSGHLSRSVETDELKAADLIVAMTSVHVREIGNLLPEVVDRVVLMKELREIRSAPVGPEATKEEKVQTLLSGERPKPRRALDVDDPMGMPMGAYERCVAELQEGVDTLVKLLC